MTDKEADFIGSMNMCDEISNEAYKKIMCNCEVLEQQPCEDCISREEALKIMCDNCPMYNCVCGCSSYRHIEKMPSVTPQTRWISVNERLPEKYETVLLTSIWHEVEKAMYIGDGLFDIIINNLQKEEVIAWMPLPQPYAESEDGE